MGARGQAGAVRRQEAVAQVALGLRPELAAQPRRGCERA